MTQLEAEHREGLRLYYLQKYDEAIAQLTRTAEAGSVETQYFLAWIYENGSGIERDYGRAAYWFSQAAQNGDSEAQLSFAMICALGKGVEPDVGAACCWATRAYHQGNHKALQTLQVIRSRAEGEAAAAKEAFQTAHRAGDTGEAVRQLERAAACGDADAQFALGQLLLGGKGVEENPEEAKLWLRDAAEQGHEAARLKLTELVFGAEAAAQ